MNNLIKILLIIGLLVLSISAIASEGDNNQIISNKVLVSFGLSSDVYSIEIITNGLSTTDLRPNELDIKPLYNIEPLGRFTVIATVTRNGQEVESGQVRLFIHKFANVVIANDRISRFKELTDKSVTVERKDITELREQPLASVESISGHRAKRNLMKGAILTTGDIETMPVINSHTDIHLIYAGGLFRVTSQGEALQDGRIGDYIKVKNKTSGKIVIARVVDETSAAVSQ